jgi:hypothetical protein
MQPRDLVTAYTVDDPTQAQIIKNALEVEGIECLLAGIEEATTAGIPGAPIQIQVPAAEAVRARNFLRSHEGIHAEQSAKA